MSPARLVVLVSGHGSNLQALLDACAAGELPAQVAAVISDQPAAYGLERARLAGVPALALPRLKGADRRSYDEQLAEQAAAFQPDLIILAGWMRILSMSFLGRFPGRVLNLHPALPGTFPGAHAIQDAFAAYQAGQTSHTGVMVHWVPDEGVDTGPAIAQERVNIYAEDTLETLEIRIHSVEHRLIVQAVREALSLTKSRENINSG